METFAIVIMTTTMVFWLIWIVFSIIAAIVRRIRAQPSEFAAGVARSMKADPRSWDYDLNKNWIISERASLEISLQAGNFGRVNTRERSNSGSSQIVQFEGVDRRAFCTALREWRELTALDRKQIAERRKRNALNALAA